MNRIFITGDTHCPIDIHKLNSKNFPIGKTLNKGDFLIICGDAGFVWDGSQEDKYWQKWIRDKPWTTLFVDGNHENFNLLNAYPVEEWNGGKVHRINDSLFHLMRGQVFNLAGKTFFTFGGASSHDKEQRKVNISWWAEELPNYQETNEGIDNLYKNNFQVDYIITHCAPQFIVKQIKQQYQADYITKYLDVILQEVDFRQWYCGHYHIDGDVEVEGFNFMYNKIKEIK